MNLPQVKLKDVIVLAIAIIILILKYFHLIDSMPDVLTGLLGFYIGSRQSKHDIG